MGFRVAFTKENIGSSLPKGHATLRFGIGAGLRDI